MLVYQRVRDLQDSAGTPQISPGADSQITSHSNTWKSNKAEADSVQNRLKLRKLDMNNAWISDRFMFHFISCVYRLAAKINISQIFLQASQGHVLRPPLLLDGRIQLFGTTLWNLFLGIRRLLANYSVWCFFIYRQNPEHVESQSQQPMFKFDPDLSMV